MKKLIIAAVFLCGASVMATTTVTTETTTDNKVITQKSCFNVEGMTCGGCASTIKSAVKKLNGVQLVSVNVDDHQAIVTYQKGATDEKTISGAITESGYKATAITCK